MLGPKKTAAADYIEESYPLSPMQQGMFFHGLSAPHSGVDIEQIICTLPEEIHFAAFREAWDRASRRHAILRTGFNGAGLLPRQEVHRNVRLHCEQKDWRGLTEREQQTRLDVYLQAERRRGFELNIPPLMRLALFCVRPAKYVLALTFHHLLLDGRAVVALLNEVFNLYEALCQGHELELPPPRPYRDYIEWLRKRDWSAAESFWRKQLKGFAATTPLLGVRSTGPVADENPRHTVQQVSLSAVETAELRSVAAQSGLTVNTLLQGAWAVVLSRYSGEDDVLFGVIRACRHGSVEGVESIVGLLVNTLPMRVRVAEEMRAVDWLKELRARNLVLRDYEHTPLVEIQRWSDLPPGQPLFDSIFNFQDPSWDAALRAQGGRWEKREFAVRNQPQFPLWADIYGGPEMTLKIGYDQGRIEGATVARMLGHFQSVLDGMVADLSQPVADLPLLTEAERRQLLVEWNATQADYPRQCVPELFEAQVVRTPDAVALVHGKEEVSYRELDNQANRVSRHLRSLGVGPDVPVGICVHRSPAMIAGLLGILKAGGAYLPLDPAYPKERLHFMLQDSGAPVLLAQEPLQSRFKFQTANCKVVCLDLLRLAGGDAEIPPARPRLSSDNLAYIIYTSGSSGKPKGVELSHRGLVNLLAWHQRAYGVTPADRATQFAAVSFDASVWELWPYLTAGASVHIVDDELRASAPGLAQWLSDARITLSFVPTPVAEETFSVPWPAGVPLRALLTGGDQLHRRPGLKFPASLVNHYGPTENTVVTTFARVHPAENAPTEAPPIGRPIANVQVYVLDPMLRPVPVGVPGELYIGGESLARGYRNNPALTGEKFIPNPFSATPGGRLYRTGDLVRRLADGNLQFLGRVDQQVKIRGYRIEPGEIEARLNQHPTVRECLVMARDQENGPKQLVAYLILKQPTAPPSKELSDFLRTTLPDFMVPSAFVCLDAWPLTPNAKIDRRALPAPERSQRPLRRAYVAPRDQVEETVARLWSQLLGRPRVGVHDNFFELGGHSLLAAQAVARLKESFQIQMSIRTLFEKPTVADFAKEIDRLAARRAPQRGPGLARVSRESYRVGRPSVEGAAQLAKQ